MQNTQVRNNAYLRRIEDALEGFLLGRALAILDSGAPLPSGIIHRPPGIAAAIDKHKEGDLI